MTEEEFKETVLPYHQLMMAQALRILRDREEAIDCVQDSLTLLWRARGRIDPGGNMAAYCARTAANRALEMLRGRHGPEADIGDISLPSGSTPASEMERSERMRMLREAMRQLPEMERKVIMMKAVAGMSGEQIAEATGLSHANVRVLIHRGRTRLKEIIKNRE